MTLDLAGSVKAIHGLDVSPKMIALAKEKAAARKIDNVDFSSGSIFDGQFEAGSFDAILAFNILHLLEDVPQAALRINELLRPGGWLISTTPCMGEKNSLMYLPMILFAKIMGIPSVSLYKYRSLEELITNGNFQIVETKNSQRDPLSYFIAAKKL